MKRSLILVIALVLSIVVLALPAFGRASLVSDGWTWNEAQAPEGLVPAQTGWTWDEAQPTADGWTWDETGSTTSG